MIHFLMRVIPIERVFIDFIQVLPFHPKHNSFFTLLYFCVLGYCFVLYARMDGWVCPCLLTKTLLHSFLIVVLVITFFFSPGLFLFFLPLQVLCLASCILDPVDGVSPEFLFWSTYDRNRNPSTPFCQKPRKPKRLAKRTLCEILVVVLVGCRSPSSVMNVLFPYPLSSLKPTIIGPDKAERPIPFKSKVLGEGSRCSIGRSWRVSGEGSEGSCLL